jgi:hypothetical protein
MRYEQVHAEDTNDFHVTLSIAPEEMHPSDCFGETEDVIKDMCDKIDSGQLLWFVARVEAYRHGVLLASDYLGGCMYDSIKDFIADGYYEDMVSNVVREAKETLAKLGR